MRSLCLCLGLLAPWLAAQTPAQTVKEDNYPLRAGCADTEPTVASLKKGDPVRIRFALSANSRSCYSVSVETGGQKLSGYVWADGLTGLEDFDQARRKASSAVLPSIARSAVDAVREKPAPAPGGKADYALAAEVFRAADALQAGRAADAEAILSKVDAPRGHRDVTVIRSAALIEMNQPDRALDLLEAALRLNKQDPQLLSMAGMAAYRNDDPRRALGYWRDYLDQQPDPAIEKLYRKVQQEASADKSAERSYGMRFLVRYDGQVADPALARAVVDALEQEFSRISLQLGCRTEERIVTILQTRQAYQQTTGAREWSGGQYDGRIRIPLAGIQQVDAATRQALAHEVVHACLANIAPWPAWLHEGMAQKLSGESAHPAARQRLRELARAGQLPKLSSLSRSFSTLNAEAASLRYTQALEAVELFFRKHSHYGARNLMQNPDRLPQIAADLDRELMDALR